MIYSTRNSYYAIGAALLLSVFASCAKAEPYVVAGIGQGEAQLAYGTAAGDVAWQQKGFPHSESLTTRTYHLGLGVGSKYLAGEVSYHKLGRISQKGQWLYNDDGSRNCSCPCFGEGSAPVKGWSLAGIVRYPFGNFSIGVEAGAFKWQSAWRETISDRHGNVSYHDPVKTSGVGALTGIVLSYRAFDLRYETFKVEPRDGVFDRMNVLRANYMLKF